jgi:hypothetical protein
MKKPYYILLFVLALSTSLISCQPEDNNDNPDLSLRSKIVDYWKVNEQSQVFKSPKSYYTVEILKDSHDSSIIWIDNFYNLGYGKRAKAKVNDNYSIDLPNQNVDGFQIYGSGQISTNLKTITWEYITNDGEGLIDSVKATYTRE